MIYIVNNFDSTLFLRFFLFHVLCGGNIVKFFSPPQQIRPPAQRLTGGRALFQTVGMPMRDTAGVFAGNFLPYAKIPVDCINSTSIMTGAT